MFLVNLAKPLCPIAEYVPHINSLAKVHNNNNNRSQWLYLFSHDDKISPACDAFSAPDASFSIVSTHILPLLPYFHLLCNILFAIKLTFLTFVQKIIYDHYNTLYSLHHDIYLCHRVSGFSGRTHVYKDGNKVPRRPEQQRGSYL